MQNKFNTIATEAQFENRYYKFLQERENDTEREDIHLDTVGIPTVGVGLALAYKINTGKKDANDKIIYRYQMKSHAKIKEDLRPSGQRDITDAEYAIITETVNKLNTEGPVKSKDYFDGEKKRENLTYRLPAGAPMKAVAIGGMRESSQNVMRDIEKRGQEKGWPQEKIDEAKSRIGNDPDSMLALSSLRYNGVRAPKTIDALAEGNKAEAYYEIVYATNGGNSSGLGIANRRIAEGKELLNDSSTWNAGQKNQWNEMRKRYADEITKYENDYPKVGGKRQELDKFSDFETYSASVSVTKSVPPEDPDARAELDTTLESESELSAEPLEKEEPDDKKQPSLDDRATVKKTKEEHASLDNKEEDEIDSANTTQLAQDLQEKFMAPSTDPVDDLLSKNTWDLTENETHTLMQSPVYTQGDDPRTEDVRKKVRGWYETYYGNKDEEQEKILGSQPYRPTRSLPTEETETPQQRQMINQLGTFASNIAKVTGKEKLSKTISKIQNGLNILDEEDKFKKEITPPLKVDGVFGEKTQNILKQKVRKKGVDLIGRAVGVGSIGSVMKDIVTPPFQRHEDTEQRLNKTVKRAAPLLFSNKSKEQASHDTGLMIQRSLNQSNETKEPLKEDGIIGPKTTSSFFNAALDNDKPRRFMKGLKESLF